ncbi:MAG: hypothetical protein N2318_03455 [Meiothermus sp.]|uniref:hypothetical protein n=1 Tax=Meiothermus cerbereus TaxID=65552 RepID=UPI003EE9D396|nr:hypothetical protein [Meiothermus sp.]
METPKGCIVIALGWLFILTVALVSLPPDKLLRALLLALAVLAIGLWVALVVRRR